MRLAWFTPETSTSDDTPLLIRSMRARHDVDVIDAGAAHDFVPQHAHKPYDLCIYELDNTPAHQFVWPYLVHYPGVTRLRRMTLQTSRARTLELDGRLDDFAREFAFNHPGFTPPILRVSGLIAPGRWPMLAIPLLASRLTVVPHAAIADTLAADYPGVQVRAITPGVQPLEGSPDEIVLALEWPVDGAPLAEALAGLGAGRAVVVFDCPETADWPSLDPQDWRPRSSETPMCVAIDPRDADHSRRLAVRRLEEDGALRAQLGAAGRAWWKAHATVAHAVGRFEEVLGEARRCEAPPRASGWPSHLTEDGLSRAREVLASFDVQLPF
jgi:hypothetical protein